MEKNEIVTGFDAFLRGGAFTHSTCDGYQFCLNRWLSFFEELNITHFRQVTHETVESFIEARKAQSVSGGTIRRDVGVLRSAWAFVIQDGRWEVPLCPVCVTRHSLATATARGRAATPAEWQALLAACCQKQHRDILTIAVETGLSEPELCNLQWREVSLGHRIIVLRRRQIPLSDTALRVLMQIERVPGLPWVFSQDGRKLKNLSSWWIGVRDRSGSEHFRFRDIRHTFATKFISDGGDIHELARILGIKLGAAATYVHLTSEQVHEEVRRGDELRRIKEFASQKK